MRILPAVGIALALVLTACSSSSDTTPLPPPNNIVLSNSPVSGAHSFFTTGDTAGNYVETYIGSDNNGFMLVSPDDSQPAGAYITINGTSLLRNPAPSSTETLPGTVTSAAALPMSPLTLATAAGTYRTTASGTAVTLTISSTGAISGSGPTWTAAGTLLGTSSITGALPFTLTLTGITGLSGTFTGYAINSPANAPASLRLVGQNGTTVLDWMSM